MNRQVEHANGLRGLSTFPTWWGRPEVRAIYSEQRVGWLLRNIAEDTALARRGLKLPRSGAGSQPRTMSGREALARAMALH